MPYYVSLRRRHRMALRVGTMIVSVLGTIAYWWAARRRGLVTTAGAIDWHPVEA